MGEPLVNKAQQKMYYLVDRKCWSTALTNIQKLFLYLSEAFLTAVPYRSE